MDGERDRNRDRNVLIERGDCDDDRDRRGI